MDYMKYVIVESMGHEVPVIFSPLLSHGAIVIQSKIVAAGFCSLDKIDYNYSLQRWQAKICCWGESHTLKLKSRFKDEQIIAEAIVRTKNEHCVVPSK